METNCINTNHPEYERLVKLLGGDEFSTKQIIYEYWKEHPDLTDQFPDRSWFMKKRNDRNMFQDVFLFPEGMNAWMKKRDLSFSDLLDTPKLGDEQVDWIVSQLNRVVLDLKDQPTVSFTGKLGGKAKSSVVTEDGKEERRNENLAMLGTFFHGVLDKTSGAISQAWDDPEAKEEEVKLFAREAVRKTIQRAVPKLHRDSGGRIRLNDPKAIEGVVEDLAEFLTNLTKEVQILHTEIPILHRNRSGEILSGRIDLLFRHRERGYLGIADWKTSFTSVREGSKSRFDSYNADPILAGDPRGIDEVNLQTLAYKTAINELWVQHHPEDPNYELVTHRAFVPIEIRGLTATGKKSGDPVLFPTNIAPALLRNTEWMSHGLYYLMDRPEYLYKIRETISGRELHKNRRPVREGHRRRDPNDRIPVEGGRHCPSGTVIPSPDSRT